MNRIIAATLLLMAELFALPATAADFATADAPVTIKVGYAAGGAADVAIRMLLPALQAQLKRPVIVENLGGAGGAVAMSATLTRSDNGSTLLGLTGDDFTFAPFGAGATSNRANQFRLVYPLRFVDVVLATSLGNAPVNVAELVDLAQKEKKAYTFGNSGLGTSGHIAAADFQAQTGVGVIHVPFKGASLVLQALLAKQIDFGFLPLNGQLIDLIKQKKVNAVFVASDARSAYLPELPHAGEGQLLKDYKYRIWPAIFIAKSASERTVGALYDSISTAVHSAEYTAWARTTGASPFVPMSMAQTQAFIKSEQERASKAVKKLDLPSN